MVFLPLTIPEIILIASAFFITTFLGLAVFLKNPGSWTNRFFLALALVFDVYIIVNSLSLHPPILEPQQQLFWIRLVMAVAAFISPLLFLLVHTFPGRSIRLSAWSMIFIIAVTLGVAILAAMPFVFNSISYPSGQPVPLPGPAMPIWILHFGWFVLNSFIILLLRIRKATGYDKAQYMSLGLGVLFTFVFIAGFTVFSIVVLQTPTGVFLGPLFPIVLMIPISYSILTKRFLDIQPLVARAVAYSFFTVFIVSLYVAALLAGFALLTGALPRFQILIISALAMTVLALTFYPLQNVIKRLSDRIFFKGLYNSEKLLAELSHLAGSTLNLQELTAGLLGILLPEMRLTRGSFLLLDDGYVTDIAGSGYSEAESAAILSADFKNLFKQVSAGENILLLDNLQNADEKDLFRKHKMEVLLPLSVNGRLIAALILGSKASGTAYSSQDLRILDVLSSEAAIAIQNARLYTDLKKASEAKSQFINVVSHQLRTPVSKIRWGLEMMRQEPELTADKRRLMENIYLGAAFLGEQLDDILVALDIYDRKLSVKKESCDIKKIFQQAKKDFQSLAASKKLKIVYAVDADAAQVYGDFDKLEKIAKILLKNAIVYSPAGGSITISARRDQAGQAENNILVAVSDQGIGVSDLEQSHIFEEFFRGEKARLAWPDGLGVGLFIAEAFIKAQQGKIWVSSSGGGKGSVFYFSLPNNI